MKHLAAVLTVALLAACASPLGQTSNPDAARNARFGSASSPITHVVVIMQENRSFDNMFHGFPGANTVDFGFGHGKKYVLQPTPLIWKWDLRHDHLQFLEDYAQGKDNGFDSQIEGLKKNCADPANHPACWIIYQAQTMKSMAFSYVEQSQVKPYWDMAQQYALGDDTFSSNNGPSFVSHQYLVAGQSDHSVEVPDGQPWGCDAPPSENLTVNLLQYGQTNPPVFSKATGIEVPGPAPCFGTASGGYDTMADMLDAAHITWRYYVAATGSGANLSAYDAVRHIRYGPDWANVIMPDTVVLQDIANDNLAQVSWIMPTGKKSDHAGPDSGKNGPAWVASIVNAIGQSPYWNNTAIIIMWDEWGGWYDHVHPPQYPDPQTKAREGLGFRVPLIIVSPYAKAGYISHQQHEVASTLRFIEETFNLGWLGSGSGQTYADRRADGFDDMFDFTQAPISFKPIASKVKGQYFVDHADNTPGDTY